MPHASLPTHDERMSGLFTPLRLRSMRLCNRFAMAPMTRRASPGAYPAPMSPTTTRDVLPAESV